VTGPRDGADLDTRRVAETLHRAASLGDTPVTVGVSRVLDGPLGLAEAHAQATAAARIGHEVSGAGVVTHFDDLGAFRLLALVQDTAELDRFVDEVLGPLARDGADATDQRATLATLLDTNLNVAETARRLHFHYNTVRYRVAKLEALLGPFTDDARLRLDLQLALQVVRLRSARAR
jgi:PucR family transcriptional regulator, purine catabolism regulatory protein